MGWGAIGGVLGWWEDQGMDLVGRLRRKCLATQAARANQEEFAKRVLQALQQRLESTFSAMFRRTDASQLPLHSC